PNMGCAMSGARRGEGLACTVCKPVRGSLRSSRTHCSFSAHQAGAYERKSRPLHSPEGGCTRRVIKMDNVPIKIPGTNYVPHNDRERRHRSSGQYGRIMLFCGSATTSLGCEIADHLHIKPGGYERDVFSNENIFIQLKESVRGQDVYLVQTLCSPIH